MSDQVAEVMIRFKDGQIHRLEGPMAVRWYRIMEVALMVAHQQKVKFANVQWTVLLPSR